MEAKSQEMRDEISKLREKIGRLESEEKGILYGMAAREKEVELVEKAVGELFTEIGAEITDIKKRIEDFTAESAVSQPIQPSDSLKSYIGSEEEGDGEQKSEISESSAPQDEEEGDGEQKSEIRESAAPQDTEFQKKCPMCGGRMNFYSTDEMWVCYSCAYEELKKDEVHSKSKEKSEHTSTPKPTPASEPILDPSSPIGVPLAPLFPDEYPKSKKGSSPSNNQPSSKKKTCPVCRKKMNWYQMEKTWRCPFCDYERSI
jgi:DNA-directed RNA polymerase subunit M/transcription elongation factor TFIIS